jgi:hypothetical protein
MAGKYSGCTRRCIRSAIWRCNVSAAVRSRYHILRSCIPMSSTAKNPPACMPRVCVARAIRTCGRRDVVLRSGSAVLPPIGGACGGLPAICDRCLPGRFCDGASASEFRPAPNDWAFLGVIEPVYGGGHYGVDRPVPAEAVGRLSFGRIAVRGLSKKFIFEYVGRDPTVRGRNDARSDRWSAWRVGYVPFSPISLA